MRITTNVELASTELESRVASLVKQNVAAKVTSVTSFQWACMLRAMSAGEQISFASAVDLYNQHPDVLAYNMTASKGGDDSEGLAVDTQKATVIEYWMDRSSDEMFSFVEQQLHRTPWRSWRPIQLRQQSCTCQGSWFQIWCTWLALRHC
jgi:hypothetical protein